MLKKLFAEFEKLSESGADPLAGAGAGAAGGESTPEMDALLSNMMNSMVSKDYLYPPMKEIADKVSAPHHHPPPPLIITRPVPHSFCCWC